MTNENRATSYFPYSIQISHHHWHILELGALSNSIKERGIPDIQFFRKLAFKLNNIRPEGAPTVHAGELNLYATLQKTLRFLIDDVANAAASSLLIHAVESGGFNPKEDEFRTTSKRFVELFPPSSVLIDRVAPETWLADTLNNSLRTHQLLREMLLLRLAASNPAIESFRELVDDTALASSSNYSSIIKALDSSLQEGPLLKNRGCTLFDALMAAIKAAPDSLAGQITYLKGEWHNLLPPELLVELEISLDILHEEQLERGGNGEPPPAPVLQFKHNYSYKDSNEFGNNAIFNGFDYPAYEAFSSDASWMSHVVLMAKMVYVWLDQLSRSYRYPITMLDQIPDSELDILATRGFTALWLIGLWERSEASQRIKQICGNPEAIASAYSLYDYEVAADLGGWEALANLRDRCKIRGIRLASDMVPNHTGIYSRWVIQHPDWFVQTDYPPFPTYQFNGENLSADPNISLQVEDGYWNKSDAAVVFKRYDKNSGQTRFIYHGNDGTSTPWNDTAQLNYLIPELREAVIQTILHVARNFPIIRFDAAMTLAKKHYQRLWFPLRGHGGGIPSRAEHGMSKEEFDSVFPVEFWREVVDRVASEAPGTLLLAEAFWMMEGYFVRTLGMHRVYNSAFMNMLMTEENAKYRTTIKNVLEFNHEILKRFVNFMNNPDEKTAVAQFGSQGKYFGACVLLSTMPGLPMFGHGQIEGFHEKYGMEYKRAYWEEQVDNGLVRGHEMWIFPLLKRRWLFSGSENFVLYDFHTTDYVDENVFAYSNRVDKHRAIVLYNNCHSKTAGWIRESVPFLANGEDENGRLDKTNLADALLISATDDNSYIAFKDQTQGVEYLRSSREIAEKGLYVELSEYQFHVFMDFREIQDDAEFTWRQLYNELNGTGVNSLEDERKQLIYEELNAQFKIIFELFYEDNFFIGTAENDAELLKAIDLFFQNSATNDRKYKISRKKIKSASIEKFICFMGLKDLKATTADARSFQLRLNAGFSEQPVQCTFLAFLILRETRLNPIALGLDYTLRKFIYRDADPEFIVRAPKLLLSLLDWWNSPKRVSNADSMKQIAVIFELETCKAFLLDHESEGVRWFNKERFEEMYEWMHLILILDDCKSTTSAKAVSLRMGEAECLIAAGFKLAKDVGYRSKLFAEMIGKQKPSILKAKDNEKQMKLTLI